MCPGVEPSNAEDVIPGSVNWLRYPKAFLAPACVVIILSLIGVPRISAQAAIQDGSNRAPSSGHQESGELYLLVQPTFLLPFLDSSDIFTSGGGFCLGVERGFGMSRIQPKAGFRVDYGVVPFKADDSVSIFSGEARGGVSSPLGPRFQFNMAAGLGYYFGFINSNGHSGSNFTLSAGTDVRYLLSPGIDLYAGVGYKNYLALFHGLTFNLGTTMHLRGQAERASKIESSTPLRPELLMGAKPHRQGHGVEIEKIELSELFPVFHKYYDVHPLGRALIANREPNTVGDIKLSFFIKQYMDAPQACPAPSSLGRGESLAVDLVALISDRILEATESTKVQAEIVLEYRLGEDLYRDVRTVSLRVFDRNAMTWEDDRRAAAFVTAKDPKVLGFSKAVSGLIRDRGPQAIDPNLLYGIGIFKTLDLAGLSYVVDPKTPFTRLSSQRTEVDYLQFPRQTLEFKAGDCDDLSILWCALMESIGIETAFITVPGHILAAFALSESPSRAAVDFTNMADLIIREGRVWIPVELTERRRGFLAAWQEGARQWREASSKGAARFYPIHEAWEEFEPVALPGGTMDVSMPPADSIIAAFLQETTRFVDREIFPKVSKLEAELKEGKGGPAEHNKLGILYAKYGKMDKAEAEFIKAMGKGDFVPAIINLGNLKFLARDFEKARSYYERALKLGPNNPTVLVNLVCVYYEQEQYGAARSSFERLAKYAPALAQQYAYLFNSSSDTRGASTGSQRTAVLWGGEE